MALQTKPWVNSLPRYAADQKHRFNKSSALVSGMFTSPAALRKVGNVLRDSEHLSWTTSPVAHRPFHFEANDFFELPVAKYQLAQRAAERQFASPLWFREESLDLLHLQMLPFEAPIPLWLPQCGEEFRPMKALQPTVQHTVLRHYTVPVFLTDHTHIVLAVDYARELHDLTAAAAPVARPNWMRPRYSWQYVTPQFAAIFDSAWDLVAPHFVRSQQSANCSRASLRDVPPPCPRKKMWVSMAAARELHAEGWSAAFNFSAALSAKGVERRADSSLRDASTVKLPHFAGMFVNACQLYPSELVERKTEEVVRRAVTLMRKELVVTGTSGTDSETDDFFRRASTWPGLQSPPPPALFPYAEQAPAAQDLAAQKNEDLPVAAAKVSEVVAEDLILFAEDELHVDEPVSESGTVGVAGRPHYDAVVAREEGFASAEDELLEAARHQDYHQEGSSADIGAPTPAELSTEDHEHTSNRMLAAETEPQQVASFGGNDDTAATIHGSSFGVDPAFLSLTLEPLQKVRVLGSEVPLPHSAFDDRDVAVNSGAAAPFASGGAA